MRRYLNNAGEVVLVAAEIDTSWCPSDDSRLPCGVFLYRGPRVDGSPVAVSPRDAQAWLDAEAARFGWMPVPIGPQPPEERKPAPTRIETVYAPIQFEVC